MSEPSTITTADPPSAGHRFRISSRLPLISPVPANRRRQRRRVRVMIGVDALALTAALLASAWSADAEALAGHSLGWSIFYSLVSLQILAVRGGYRYRLEVSPFEHVGQVVIATALALTVTVTLRVLIGDDGPIAADSVRLWAFGLVYMIAARFARATVEQRPGRPGARTLIIGAGQVGELVARRLHDRPELGLRPIGFLDKEPREHANLDVPVLGASWDLEEVARRHEVEHVVVTFSTAPHHVLLDLVRRCRGLGLEVSLVPRLFEQISNRVSVDHLGGIALLRVDQADPRGWQFELKYAADRVFAALLLLLLSPLLLVLTVLVRLSSTGPILFRQARVGRDGREFGLLKFRTMRELEGSGEFDAAWAARSLGIEDASATFEGAGEPVDRRTPVGRFLRRWSLDELPQLFNILLGDMSFVGPRPERIGYVRAFEQHVYRYGDRHRVKSGLTGWAQVHGLRGDTSLLDRIEWDNYYVENWRPWLDLKILLLTVPAVLDGTGVE